jgi:hypothetical protein
MFLVHEITLHPVKNSVEHVDFYVPEAGKKIHANIHSLSWVSQQQSRLETS